MKVWFCRNCGYEVTSRGRCHRCKQRLVAAHLEQLTPGADDEEVGYRLEDWADRTRGRLIEALVVGGVAHRFEGDELVVTVGDEQRTDAIVERVTATAELDGLPEGVEPSEELVEHVVDEIDEEVESALRQLLRASKRLRVDPTDMEADGEVAEASTGVFMVEGWSGSDDDTWAAVGRVTRRLLAALGSEDALEEEITTEAAVLDTLLEPLLVAPGAAPAPAAGRAGVTVPADGVAGVTALDDRAAREDEAAGEAAAAALGLATGAAGPFGSDDVDGPEDIDGSGDIDGPEAIEEADDVDGSKGAPVSDVAAGTGGGPADDPGDGLLGGVPETSYEAPGWLPDQRALLTVLLDRRSIGHVWDGTDLVVPSAEEEAVEALFDKIGGVAEDEDDEARYRSIEELFAAVTRLVADPDDEIRGAEVVRRASAVEGPTPLGFDDGAWLGLRRRARTLADAVEHKAHPDVIAGQAAALRDSLRSFV